MFFRNITADYRRIYDLAERKNPLTRAIYPFSCPGFHALFWFRLIQANRYWRIPVLFFIFALPLRIINTFVQWFWGICIASNSDIGPGLYIAHHGQIFVGVKSMGANCTIGHSVTIGRTEREHGYPTIGNNVYIAPGALVIGTVEIGDNVKIGPNAVVRRNVAPNSVVMAPPPRVIRMTTKEEWQKEREAASKKESQKPGQSHTGTGNKRNEYRKPSDHYKKPAPTGRSSRDRSRDRNHTPTRDNHKGNQNSKDGKPRYTKASENKTGHRPRREKFNPHHKRENTDKTPRENPAKGATQDVKPSETAKRERLEDGSSRGVTSEKDRWAEDMEGESLDG